jgi:hypothetical protein
MRGGATVDVCSGDVCEVGHDRHEPGPYCLQRPLFLLLLRAEEIGAARAADAFDGAIELARVAPTFELA